MQQVAFADDADHPIIGVDDRDAADPALAKECCQSLHRLIRVGGDDIGRHHIHRAHRYIPVAEK